MDPRDELTCGDVYAPGWVCDREYGHEGYHGGFPNDQAQRMWWPVVVKVVEPAKVPAVPTTQAIPSTYCTACGCRKAVVGADKCEECHGRA